MERNVKIIAMVGMDKPKLKKRILFMKVFWVGIITVALVFLSYRVVFNQESSKFNVGINVVGADRRLGKETDGRFEASISSKINERVTINGKFGVPFGGINQTAFIGNVELLWRLNEEGTLNGRIFNKENDVNYIGQGIGYTQGLGFTYEVDFDTFKELIQKMFKKKRVIQTIPAEYLDQDSDMTPEFIQFSTSKKSTKEQPKQNREGRVPEED